MHCTILSGDIQCVLAHGMYSRSLPEDAASKSVSSSHAHSSTKGGLLCGKVIISHCLLLPLSVSGSRGNLASETSAQRRWLHCKWGKRLLPLSLPRRGLANAHKRRFLLRMRSPHASGEFFPAGSSESLCRLSAALPRPALLLLRLQRDATTKILHTFAAHRHRLQQARGERARAWVCLV
ncbi:hypothetical protein GQ54DRAFT_173208 [Martensiomyces pterosporus]|nr:hypothetical protein GQ54DRAFT_173208 [Martensiomyces pterosporus]